MKKKKSNYERKVIPFPNLEERLTEKGMEALKNKKFNEALLIFEQVSEMTGNPDIEIGIVICLFELGELEVAKQKCKKILHEDISDYYQALQIYITICIQQGEYEEVQTILEAVLNESKFPANYAENFFRLLDFSRKMNNVHHQSGIKQSNIDEFNNSLNESEDVREHWNAIQSLRNSNLVTMLPFIETFLKDHKKHPMLKTMILELLHDHGINKEMSIEKFDEVIYFNPINLKNINEQQITNEVLTILDEKLFNKNPTLFEVVKEIWLRHLFVIYPFLPQPEQPNSWAAALFKLGSEMHGIEIKEESLDLQDTVEDSILTECYNRIIKTEGISFLQF